MSFAVKQSGSNISSYGKGGFLKKNILSLLPPLHMYDVSLFTFITITKSVSR